MQGKKTVVVFFLLCAMLLQLCACQTNDAPTQPPTETTEAPIETTEPPATAESIYADAISALTASTEGEYDYVISTTRSTGDAVYSDDIVRTVYYKDLGTDSMTAVVDSDIDFPGGNSFQSREVYSEGTVYYFLLEEETTEDNERDSSAVVYSAEMDADQFVARQLPLALLDASLYGSITLESESVLSFSEPTALESWVAPEYAELIDASGKVNLNTDGSLRSAVYEVSYTQGPVTVEQSYTLRPAASTAEDLQSYLPETEETVSVEDINIPYLVAYAEFMAYSIRGSGVAVDSQVVAYSQGAGVTYSMYGDLYAYGTGDGLISKLDQSISATDQSGSYAYDYVESYKDRSAVTTINGEEAETMNDIGPASYADYLAEISTSYLPLPDFLESAEISELAGFWYIKFTGNEDYSLYLEDLANYDLFSDEDLLDDLASDYKTDLLEGYLFIDKDTLLPVSMGVDLECRHNVEDYYYSLYYYVEQTFSYGDRSVYWELTGEMFPEEEPEEKAHPVFYEVRSAEGQTMYLLGTIHVGDTRTAYLPQEIYTAFEASDALAVEVDILSLYEQMETDEQLQEEIGMSYYLTDGTTLGDHLEETLYESTLDMAKLSGMSSVAEYMYPSVLASQHGNTLLYSANVLTSEQGVDNRLLRMAREQDKEVLEVESAQLQFGMDAQYSDLVHKYLVMDALETDRNEYLEGILNLYELWCAGDEAALIEYLQDDELPEDAEEELIQANEEYNSIMLANRDAGMLETAKGYMESGKTVFFAVGLAHLLGETGLVEALREAGYTVTLVEYAQ